MIDRFFDGHFLGSFLSYCLLWFAMSVFLSFHGISSLARVLTGFVCIYIIPLAVFTFFLMNVSRYWREVFSRLSFGNTPIIIIMLCMTISIAQHGDIESSDVWKDALLFLFVLCTTGRSLHDALLLCGTPSQQQSIPNSGSKSS